MNQIGKAVSDTQSKPYANCNQMFNFYCKEGYYYRKVVNEQVSENVIFLDVANIIGSHDDASAPDVIKAAH